MRPRPASRPRSGPGARSPSPPVGIPSRSRRNPRSQSPATTCWDSHRGDSWAMPVRLAPSSHSPISTMASDQSAARRTSTPMSDEEADVGRRAGRGRDGHRPRRLGHARRSAPTAPWPAPASPGRRASRPASGRAAITSKRTGESHVSGKEPDRTSAPSTASPMTRQVRGRISRKMPVLGHVGEADRRAAVVDHRQPAEEQGAGARQQDPRPPLGGQAGPQRVADDGHERRGQRLGPLGCAPARTWGRSSQQLPEDALQRVVQGTHLTQAGPGVPGGHRAAARPAHRRGSRR